jgi:hypothetical protein
LLPTIVRKILIPKWRAAVKIRPYILYWMEHITQTLCAKDGRYQKEDLNSFEKDFNNITFNIILKN